MSVLTVPVCSSVAEPPCSPFGPVFPMLDAAAPYTVFVTHGICSGKMGQQVAAAPTVNPREMKKMETDIEQLAEEYKNLQTSRQHLEDEIIRYKKN